MPFAAVHESAFGTKRTSKCLRLMSASGGIGDPKALSLRVRQKPVMSSGTLFNHRTFENPKQIFCEEIFVQSDSSTARINGISGAFDALAVLEDANGTKLSGVYRLHTNSFRAYSAVQRSL